MIRNLTLACASLVIFLLGIEAFCRVLKPDERWFRDPYAKENPLFRLLRYDPLLGWTQRPGAKVLFLDERLNSRGLRGPDFPDEKRPGTVRIVALGDSCTFNVQFSDVTRKPIPLIELEDPFPSILEGMLAPLATPGRRYQVVNGGVLGYSMLQGLRFFRRDVLRWNPDVILVRYVWNDHWAADPAYRIRSEPRSAALRWIRWQMLRSRFYAFMVRLITTAMGQTLSAHPTDKPVPAGDAPPANALRAPPEEFAFGLRLIVQEARARGVIPILATAPAGVLTEKFRRSEAYAPMMRSLGYTSAEEVFRVHRRYNAIVRRVAREEHAPLLDLDAAFAARGRGRFFGPTEIIHPNRRGNALIAELTLEELRRLRVVPAGPAALPAAEEEVALTPADRAAGAGSSTSARPHAIPRWVGQVGWVAQTNLRSPRGTGARDASHPAPRSGDGRRTIGWPRSRVAAGSTPCHHARRAPVRQSESCPRKHLPVAANRQTISASRLPGPSPSSRLRETARGAGKPRFCLVCLTGKLTIRGNSSKTGTIVFREGPVEPHERPRSGRESQVKSVIQGKREG